jgi:hypothetical protein
MLSPDPHRDTSVTIAGIPRHQLHGPLRITVEQPDGSCVRMTYCPHHATWLCILFVVTEGDLITSPLPPISVVLPQGYA